MRTHSNLSSASVFGAGWTLLTLSRHLPRILATCVSAIVAMLAGCSSFPGISSQDDDN